MRLLAFLLLAGCASAPPAPARLLILQVPVEVQPEFPDARCLDAFACRGRA